MKLGERKQLPDLKKGYLPNKAPDDMWAPHMVAVYALGGNWGQGKYCFMEPTEHCNLPPAFLCEAKNNKEE